MAETFEIISVRKVIFRIATGKRIGYLADQFGNRSVLEWKSPTIEAEDQYIEIVKKQLRNYGYNVFEETDDLFGSSSAEKARFQIGAIIKDVHITNVWARGITCIANFCEIGNRPITEMTMDVEWQIHDGFASTIVLKQSIQGYYYEEKDLKNIDQVFYDTYENSFLRFMAFEEFTSTLGGK